MPVCMGWQHHSRNPSSRKAAALPSILARPVSNIAASFTEGSCGGGWPVAWRSSIPVVFLPVVAGVVPLLAIWLIPKLFRFGRIGVIGASQTGLRPPQNRQE